MVMVRIQNNGFDWFLKATTWTNSVDRADKFNDEVTARSAALNAKKFMPAASFKKIEYITI